jgi:hypothetical protein
MDTYILCNIIKIVFESVSIDDIVGDLDDLIGSKILMSECVTKKERKER